MYLSPIKGKLREDYLSQVDWCQYNTLFMIKKSEKNTRSIIKSSSHFGFTTLISRISGFIRDILFANYFGANANTDAFFVAFKIPNFFRRLFAEGALSQSFIPVFQEFRINKSKLLKEFVQNIFGNLFVVLLIIVALGMYFSEELTYLFAPGFANDELNLASEMLFITFPYLLFISLTALCAGIFNSHDRFILSGITPFFLNLSLIFFTIFSSSLFVIPIISLSYGLLVGGVLQLAIQLPLMYKLGFLSIPKINFYNQGSMKVIKLMGPAILGTAAVQINLLIDTIVASLLVAGSISWLYFSDRLIELPLAIFGIAISIVILPVLSGHFQKKETSLYSNVLTKSVRLAMLIAIPSMCGLAILSGSIVSTLYMYGNFLISDVNMTVLSLIAYSLGLPAFIFLKILVTAFYSRQDTKTPVIYSLIGISINILSNLTILYFYLQKPFEGAHALIALGTSLSAWIQVSLMSFKLTKIGIIKENIFFNMSSSKIIIASSIMVVILFFYGNIQPFGYDTSLPMRSGYLILDVLVGASIYFVSLLLLRIKLRSYKI
jgi:putative peptidoglycan lipid II flippase